jgi:hypothetical protein
MYFSRAAYTFQVSRYPFTFSLVATSLPDSVTESCVNCQCRLAPTLTLITNKDKIIATKVRYQEDSSLSDS